MQGDKFKSANLQNLYSRSSKKFSTFFPLISRTRSLTRPSYFLTLWFTIERLFCMYLYALRAATRVRASGQSAVSTVIRSGRLPDAPHSPISLRSLRSSSPTCIREKRRAYFFPRAKSLISIYEFIVIRRKAPRHAAPRRKTRRVGRTDITCLLTSRTYVFVAKLVARVKESRHGTAIHSK